MRASESRTRLVAEDCSATVGAREAPAGTEPLVVPAMPPAGIAAGIVPTGTVPIGTVPTGAERHAARMATEPMRRDGSLRTMFTPKYYRFRRRTDTTRDDESHPIRRIRLGRALTTP
jgi:hypothetical protein